MLAPDREHLMSDQPLVISGLVRFSQQSLLPGLADTIEGLAGPFGANAPLGHFFADPAKVGSDHELSRVHLVIHPLVHVVVRLNLHPDYL